MRTVQERLKAQEAKVNALRRKLHLREDPFLSEVARGLRVLRKAMGTVNEATGDADAITALHEEIGASVQAIEEKLQLVTPPKTEGE